MTPQEMFKLYGIGPGYRFDDRGVPSVLARAGGTGMVICHPVGEPSMQDSWSMKPEDFVRHYLTTKES